MSVFDILMRWHCPNCGKHTAHIIEVEQENFDVLGDETICCQWCNHEIRVHWHTELSVVVSNQHMRLQPIAIHTEIWKSLPFHNDDEIPEFEDDEDSLN
jgi:hypothetical protein